LTALAGAASARQPYRAELAARVAREPARIDPLGLRRAPAPASFLRERSPPFKKSVLCHILTFQRWSE
jgi:hypothetical protein